MAASAAGPAKIATLGFAELVAGAMSMAVGDHVSVTSQSDAENAAGQSDREHAQPELADRSAVDLSN